MSKDLYAVLGVDRTADEQTIKRAYRKLAAKLHPDKTPGKLTEQRFKEVTAAYEVLHDPKKRAAYDEFGEVSLQQGFDPARARWAKQRGYGYGGAGPSEGVPFDFGDLFGARGGARGGAGGIGDLFGDMLGRNARGGRRGQDLETTVAIDFGDAIRGTTLALLAPNGTETVHVRIPAGAADGSRVRAKGKGAPGVGKGPPGDLVLHLQVRPHKHFRREGDDLYLDLPVTIGEAYGGASVRVPTPHGEVKLTVPRHAQSGQTVRLRGKGVARKGGHEHGDLYVRFLVKYPADDDPAVAGAIETLGARSADPRGDLAF
ncbi:MAG: DnaJ domain-containing protein [Myxococcales bacterium]|nr:DnaJ domain-containing protein [Myxococcales bacterium]